MSATLEALALGRTFGRRGVGLQPFSTHFGPGITLVLGPNGAGKSTLLRLLATTVAPTSGELRWGDRPLGRNPRAYRAVLGYLPQEFGIYERWDARSFLAYMARLKGVPEAEQAAAIEDLLRAVHLTDTGVSRGAAPVRVGVGHDPLVTIQPHHASRSGRAASPDLEARKQATSFSHGEVRRLGLAQALLNRPRVLILDEPFAGLAPEERVACLGLIALHASTSIVLLATHILDDLESYARRVLVLRRGICIADTSPAALLDDTGVDPAAAIGQAPLETAYVRLLAQA